MPQCVSLVICFRDGTVKCHHFLENLFCQVAVFYLVVLDYRRLAPRWLEIGYVHCCGIPGGELLSFVDTTRRSRTYRVVSA